MNDCQSPFYVRPYVWFLFITMILFIVFVFVIEFNTNHFNTNEAFPEWIIILFFVLIGFLFVSFIMYYWFNSRCRQNVILSVVENCYIEDQFIYNCK
jgi:hypothetical protein